LALSLESKLFNEDFSKGAFNVEMKLFIDLRDIMTYRTVEIVRVATNCVQSKENLNMKIGTNKKLLKILSCRDRN
jgi:hypothetical protein